MCTYMDMTSYADTHKMHSCKKKKKRYIKKKREKQHPQRQKFVIDKKLINATWKFSDKNPGIKKNHHLIKTVATILIKDKTTIKHYNLPEESEIH